MNRPKIDEGIFDPSQVKERITAMIDKDVKAELKRLAQQQKTKYQTLMNQILREYLFQEESTTTRLAKLEQAVFKKAT